MIEALGPMLRAAGLQDPDPGLRPQLVRAPERHRQHAAGRDLGHQRLPPGGPLLAGGSLGVGHRLPLLLRRSERDDRAAQRVPAKDIYFTECSGSQSSDPANTFSDTLKWHARNLIIGSPRNWAKTVINWNVALDPSGGPHVGGCGNCTGILTVGPGDKVTPNAEYYTLGHLSRFVKPGAVRIASTSFGTTGWNGQVMDVAFRDPDGTTVLVAHNENDNPQTFGVLEGGRSFTYTLPGDSLATFTWNGEPGRPATPADRARSVRLAGQPPTRAGRRTRAARATSRGNAVDDDATTRYSTGTGQQPGQYLQVDLGRARAGAQDRVRHRRQPRATTPRLRGDRQLRRRQPGAPPVATGTGQRAAHASCRCRARRSGSCG